MGDIALVALVICCAPTLHFSLFCGTLVELFVDNKGGKREIKRRGDQWAVCKRSPKGSSAM